METSVPNRILKESICTSENVDRLSPFEETVFYRLIVTCDDYGRMDARPKLLAARLFPLRDIRAEEMADALRALAGADLVILYEAEGKPCLQLKTWNRHQNIRAKRSRYPAPADSAQDAADSRAHLHADARTCPRNPIQSESLSESGSSSSSEAPEDPPAAPVVKAPAAGPKDDDDDGRPGGDVRHTEAGEAAARYLRAMTGRSWEELRSFMAELPGELVVWAIETACEHGGNNWAYVRRVLASLLRDGVRTVEDARLRQENRHPAPGGPRPYVNPFDDMLRRSAGGEARAGPFSVQSQDCFPGADVVS